MSRFFNLFRSKKTILLSVLINTIPQRENIFDRLLTEVLNQGIELYFKRMGVDIEIIVPLNEEMGLSIGEKRNLLLGRAKGDYVCFIDDDDRISPDYINLIALGLLTNPDCCSLTGEITTDGQNPLPFIHSIKYNKYDQRGGVYFRYPNHLNTIRASIAKQFKFPASNHGEDTDWATQIHESGLIKKEYEINKTIYYYDYLTVKPEYYA